MLIGSVSFTNDEMESFFKRNPGQTIVGNFKHEVRGEERRGGERTRARRLK